MRMPIYFSNISESSTNTSPHLLSKQQADSIPFSSSHIPYLLRLFSFSPGSDHAEAVENTLTLCELKPMAGETKFCATSLESMLDSVRVSFGTETQFKALTTAASSLQNYTILQEPEQIMAGKVMSCHTVPYPYRVYFCHASAGETKLFRVMLGGEDERGEIVEAVAICHMDTSKWDRDNPSFRVLKVKPGKGPVCHFIPRYDIVWTA
ncbi:BURP domain-containing protein BNM2C [Linum grandiflorum]